jgi:hypothetical protein
MISTLQFISQQTVTIASGIPIYKFPPATDRRVAMIEAGTGRQPSRLPENWSRLEDAIASTGHKAGYE